MKKMNVKPLLLVVPFLCIFVLLLLLDHPHVEEKKVETVGQNKTADIHIEENSEVNYEEYHVVIGKVGSVKDGGATPIYYDPNEESEELSELQYNCGVLATTEQLEENWISVDLPNMNCVGYVKKDAVEEKTLRLGSEDPLRDAIVKDAMSYIGLQFVRYGKSLTTGIDCSNFIQQIYRKHGVEIPSSPMKQKEFGVEIEESQVQPGDIIFYDKANDGTGHVGLYLGDGLIIHSSGHSGKEYPRGGVRISCLLYHDRDSYLVIDELSGGGQNEQ